jgi:putative hydrolase of HD superfamily
VQYVLAKEQECVGKMINIEMMISFLNKIEKLKCITRHSWTSDGRKESVAEHSWRLAIMIYLLRDELKECDIDKMVMMALFHDISEVKFGDVPGFNKTKNDIEKEKIVLEEISEEYKELGINQIIDVVKEFDNKVSKEAGIVNALDKLEGLIQHNEADISTWIELEYVLNLTYGIQECEVNMVIKKLREQVKKIAIDKMVAKAPAH